MSDVAKSTAATGQPAEAPDPENAAGAAPAIVAASAEEPGRETAGRDQSETNAGAGSAEMASAERADATPEPETADEAASGGERQVVLDLSGSAFAEAALDVRDGELVLILADGTEIVLTASVETEGLILKVGEEAYLSVAELLESLPGQAEPLPINETQAFARPEPAAGEPRHGGGADFRQMEIADLMGLDATMPLAPTATSGALGDAEPAQGRGDLGAFDLNRAGPINYAPDAGDDAVRTSEKSAVTIDVLANDSDRNVNDDLSVAGVYAEGVEGEVRLNDDGTIRYDPAGRFTHLGKGETAVETFSYTVSDPQGRTDTAEVEVTVEGVNDAPVAEDDEGVTNQNWPARIDVLANDHDPDANDTIEVVRVDDSGIKGEAFVNHDGTLTYRHNGAFDHLGKGEAAHETFSYTVADQHGRESTAEVTVRINGLNDAPVARDDEGVTNENWPARIDVLANDYDIDATDTIKVISVDDSGIKGEAFVNHDGTLTYRHNDQFDHLTKGEAAHETFSYTIADQHGRTATAEVTVRINGLNNAPVAHNDMVATDEDTPLTFDALANDTDKDANDSMRIVDVDASGLEGELTQNPDGTFSYDPNGRFEHLGEGETAQESFTYKVADDFGKTDTARVDITIHGVNDAPVAGADHFTGYETVGFFAPASSLLGNDSDVEGDPLSVLGVGNAVNGSVALTPEGNVVFTPTDGYTGPAGFQYLLGDGQGGHDVGDVFVDVQPITPADLEFQTDSAFATFTDATATLDEQGGLTIDLTMDVGALASGGLEIGGMPFISSILSGEMKGIIQASLGQNGPPQAVGDVFGDLDLDVQTSPIFQPLGTDFFTDVTGYGGGPASGPTGSLSAPGLPSFFDSPVDLEPGQLPVFAFAEATAQSSATAAGDGTFFLDIAGIIQGAVAVFNEDTGDPILVAELFGEFGAEAFIDIGDDLVVDADGFVQGDVEVTSAPSDLTMAGGADLLPSLVPDEPAAAAA